MNEPLSPTVLTKGTSLAIGALATILFAGGVYAAHERSQINQMADQNAQLRTSVQETSSQMQQLTAKMNELLAAKQAAEAQHVQAASHRRSGAVRAADGRWKKMQSQLDEQGKAIASTRDDLSSTRTELQGSIARTHDELVVLQRKGERNYYEFDLEKSKHFQASGPIGVRLRKANVKHQYADLELFVDDVSLTKKHVNLYEPAIFYAADSEVPVELIINNISKNHIHGYVSAPKYRRSEVASVTQSSPGTDPSSDPGNKMQHTRQQLTIPPK